MTFDEVKAAIKEAVRPFGMEHNTQLHEIVLATDWQELLDAIKPILERAYLTGRVTDDLLAEFDSTLLTNNGIYFDTTATVSTAPTVPFHYFGGFQIWILGDADITTAFTGTERYRVCVLSAKAQLTASDTVHLTIFSHESRGTLNVENTAIASLLQENPTQSAKTWVLNLSDDSNAEWDATRYATGTINMEDDAYAKIHAHDDSNITANIYEDADVLAGRTFERGMISYLAAP